MKWNNCSAVEVHVQLPFQFITFLFLWTWHENASILFVVPERESEACGLTLHGSNVNPLHGMDKHLPDHQWLRHHSVNVDCHVEPLHLTSGTTRYLQQSVPQLPQPDTSLHCKTLLHHATCNGPHNNTIHNSTSKLVELKMAIAIS